MGSFCCHNKVQDWFQKNKKEARNKIYQLQQQNNGHLVQENPSIDDLITKLKQPLDTPMPTKTIFSSRMQIQREKKIQETLQQKLEEKDTEIENLKIQMNNAQEEARIKIKELNQEIDKIRQENEQQDFYIKQLKAQIQEQTEQIKKLNSDLKEKENQINDLGVEVYNQQQVKLDDADYPENSFKLKERLYKQKIQQYQEALEKLVYLKQKMNLILRSQKDIKEKERIDELLDQLELEITNMVSIWPIPQSNNHKIVIRFNGFQENKEQQFYTFNCKAKESAKLCIDGFVHCSNNCHQNLVEDVVFLPEKSLIIHKGTSMKPKFFYEFGVTINNVKKFQEFLQQCLQGNQLRFEKFMQAAMKTYKGRNGLIN